MKGVKEKKREREGFTTGFFSPSHSMGKKHFKQRR